ncbi:MAG: PKD domain-containing protein [Roseibacillus sp.]|nr:PKD domain-containing protein [Roseibacillus sp.]
MNYHGTIPSLMLSFFLVLLSGIGVEAAPTRGNVKALGIRVTFANFKNAPGLSTIANRLQGAKVSYSRYSYGKLNITYDTVEVSLPRNRNTYDAGSLADAAELRARNKGFNPAGYAIVGFFHGGHASGNKAIVGGKRFWTNTGGATIHEMGHNFNWGHQSRWVPNGSNPIGGGSVQTPDMWHFMANSSTDADPYDKWTRDWITARHNITTEGSFTRRLYTCDQKNTDPTNDKRVLRVTRDTGNSAAYWIGFRSRLMNKQNDGATGKNELLRQGLVFYWDRGTVGGQNVVLIDIHPGQGGWDNHSLQPGETYADTAGKVCITNLGRGGETPNEYIDVRINKGAFPDNRPPEPTWDAPATWESGEPLTITITPNDPDGDEVACMWKTTGRAIPHNQSSPVLNQTWNVPGSYQVRAVVSDMKGKTATLSRTITVTGDYPVTFANAGFGTWAGNEDNTGWSADVLFDGEVAATANLSADELQGDFEASATLVRNDTAESKSLVMVVLKDPVNGAGNEPVSQASLQLSVTDVRPGYVLDGISMTSNGVVFSPEELTDIQFDGEGTTVVDASRSTDILVGGVADTPSPLTPGDTVNFIGPGAWDNPNGFTGNAHSLKWSIDAAGSTFLGGNYITESTLSLANEQLAFGVGMSREPGTGTFSYSDWATAISGLGGPEAAFEADANGDGIANGLAFLLGAQDANTDASDLLPDWSSTPGRTTLSFRRSDDASSSIRAVVEYSRTLQSWIPALETNRGVIITADDDFYEPGVDRVNVSISNSLTDSDTLFLRLRIQP